MSTYHTNQIGHVSFIELNIKNWDLSLDFYTKKIGLKLLESTSDKAVLGVKPNEPLLVLHRLSHAALSNSKTTGLYHFALLVDSRKELGKILRHLINLNVVLQGASNHGISEAIYLADPDGNGIEIAADTHPSTWPWRNEVLDVFSVNGPMDVHSVLAEAQHEVFTSLSEKTRLGHIHLHVDNLQASKNFYQNILNMDCVIDLPNSASFFSYGKYHHHIAINVWKGLNLSKPTTQASGLKAFSLWIPTQTEFFEIKDNLHKHAIPYQVNDQTLLTQDPAGNQLLIQTNPHGLN